jgi:hypothetical protein
MIKPDAKSRFPAISIREGKLIAALMSSDAALLAQLEAQLSQTFSPLELVSTPYAFDAYSAYYQSEMGVNLSKKFLCFTQMIAIDTLPEIKHLTNALEQESACDGKRRINIDPGYVTHAQMVLATTKPFSHRIYLGSGIFAELTYLCKGKRFYPLEWTYPDYRAPFAVDFFLNVRQRFLQQTRAQRQASVEHNRDVI